MEVASPSAQKAAAYITARVTNVSNSHPFVWVPWKCAQQHCHSSKAQAAYPYVSQSLVAWDIVNLPEKGANVVPRYTYEHVCLHVYAWEHACTQSTYKCTHRLSHPSIHLSFCWAIFLLRNPRLQKHYSPQRKGEWLSVFVRHSNKLFQSWLRNHIAPVCRHSYTRHMLLKKKKGQIKPEQTRNSTSLNCLAWGSIFSPVVPSRTSNTSCNQHSSTFYTPSSY